jgi:hypothetical protein
METVYGVWPLQSVHQVPHQKTPWDMLDLPDNPHSAKTASCPTCCMELIACVAFIEQAAIRLLPGGHAHSITCIGCHMWWHTLQVNMVSA